MERTVNIYIDGEPIGQFIYDFENEVSESKAYETVVDYVMRNIDIEME